MTVDDHPRGARDVTAVDQRRAEKRHAVPRAEHAFVEFEYPQPAGKRRRLALLDISSAGVCFALPYYGITGVDSSTNLMDVVLNVGACEIEGEVVVSHVTPAPGARNLCGGRFYPATEIDRLKIRKVIAGLGEFEYD